MYIRKLCNHVFFFTSRKWCKNDYVQQEMTQNSVQQEVRQITLCTKRKWCCCWRRTLPVGNADFRQRWSLSAVRSDWRVWRCYVDFIPGMLKCVKHYSWGYIVTKPATLAVAVHSSFWFSSYIIKQTLYAEDPLAESIMHDWKRGSALHSSNHSVLGAAAPSSMARYHP